MKKHKLLNTAWVYDIVVRYDVDGRSYNESFNVISHLGYCDIKYEFLKFIRSKIKRSFPAHEFNICVEIVDLYSLEWRDLFLTILH